MNRLEKQMLAILVELERSYGARYVRAEFEAEGLRVEELLQLKNVSLRAGLGISLKIGGCEGMRDLIESKNIGAESIVAPMIESAFALKKYEQAAYKVYSPEERADTKFWFNIETKEAVGQSEQILSSDIVGRMDAVVVERVDLCFSLGKGEDNVDDADIGTKVVSILGQAKSRGLKTVIGGGISKRSLGLVSELASGRQLDFFETRKVGFSTENFSEERYVRGLILAQGFEIFALKNKIMDKQHASERDIKRLGYLEMNYWNDIRSLLPEIA